MGIGARGARGGVRDKEVSTNGEGTNERGMHCSAGTIHGLPTHLPIPTATVQVGLEASTVQPPSHPDRSGLSSD